MRERLRTIVVSLICLSIIGLGSPVVAEAGIIGTLAAVESQQRDRDLATVTTALAGEQVRERFRALGVDQAQIEQRIAALTDSELRTLASQIDSMPAGAGAIEVIGIVFLVLLILEAVGVIDIFKKFP